jgi:hypothetical protein
MKQNVIIALAACRSCTIFSDAKLVRAAARQGHAQLPRNNPQFLPAIKMACPEGWIFSVKPCLMGAYPR